MRLGFAAGIVVAALLVGMSSSALAQPEPATPAPAPAPADDVAPAVETAPPAPAPAVTTPAAPPPATSAPATSAPAPAPAMPSVPSRVKVIVLDLKAGSLSSAEASAIGSLVTVALSEYEAFEVVSGADVREMLALEGQKQELGCEESMSCLAEIAGALGARVVAYGQIEKLGSLFILSLNMQDTLKNKSVGRVALQGQGLDAIAAAVPDAIKKMVEPFLRDEKLSTASASARANAPALVTTTPTAPSDHGGLLWTGAILGGIGAVLFAASYGGSLILAVDQGAPPGVIDALKVPIAGKFIVASELNQDLEPDTGTGNGGAVNNNGGDNGKDFLPILYGGALVEVLGAASAIGGGIAFASAAMMDGPELDGAGNAWRWGMILGGTALAVGGVVTDNLSPSSTDHKLDAADFVGPAMVIGGAAAAATGLLTNPFVADPTASEETR